MEISNVHFKRFFMRQIFLKTPNMLVLMQKVLLINSMRK